MGLGRALRGVRASLSLGADGLTLRALEAAGGEGTFAPLDVPGLGAVELRLAAADALSSEARLGSGPSWARRASGSRPPPRCAVRS